MIFSTVAAVVLVGSFASRFLFHFVYMVVSPRKWVRLRYVAKSGSVSAEAVNDRWVRVRIRITGFAGAVFIVLFLALFMNHLVDLANR